MSHVAWSVGVSVYAGHTDVSGNNAWTDRDAVSGADSRGPKKPLLDGVKVRWNH